MKLKNVTAFAIEGPDKVGKATQSNLLINALIDLSALRANMIEIPSKHHACYAKIYDMLKRRPDGSAPAVDHPAIFQTFQVANRFHVQEDIERMAEGGHVVIIFDRWVGSSWAYGSASEVSPKEIEAINHGLLEPDITFVLEGRGFDRPETDDDAYEDDESFQGRVRHAYQKWAESKTHVTRINADRPKEIVHDEISSTVKRHLISEGIL